MSLLILEFVPYLAFAGAGLLLAWVGADIALSKLRKARTPLEPTQESVRGLAGDPEPMSELPAETNEVTENSTGTEDDEETSEIPSSQAVNVAKTPKESDNEVSARIEQPESQEVDEAKAEAVENEVEKVEGKDSGNEADLVHSSRVVQRDPSVRVFDMSVAPSSRKVPATED